jgi:hypothetical protein
MGRAGAADEGRGELRSRDGGVLRWLASVYPSKPAGKGFEVKQEEEMMGRYRDY